MEGQNEGVAVSDSGTEIDTKKCPIPFLDKCLRKSDNASGFTFFRMGNGPVLMSNIYLSAALIALAQKEIGCNSADIKCGKVHGFKPSSLITIIGTISGVLSALLLPFIGAIVDCTNHKRKLGASVALTIIVVQAIQIGTTQSTWLIMAVLQALNGFFYQVQLLAAYSYLPEIAASVGITLMTQYSADFAAVMFTTEVFYAVLCLSIAAAISIDPGDNESRARLGQIVNVIVSGSCYFFGWYFFTHSPARRHLNEGESLCSAGFIQVFRTARGIKKHYSSTLGYFLLAAVSCNAASGSFALIAVTYLYEVCNVTGQTLGIIVLIILISAVPGSYLGAWVSNKTNPKTSMKILLISMIGYNFLAFLTMTSPEPKILPYIYGAGWGMLLGWFYPTEMLILSTIQPRGQEAEITGIFLYCAQILAWLPPLAFTIMNESGIHLKWGGMLINVYYAIGLVLYQLMAPWDECLAAGRNVNIMKKSGDNHEFVCATADDA